MVDRNENPSVTSGVTVEWGHVDPYWDVFVNDTRCISVRIDEATGAVSLNPGYGPHSVLHAAEVTAFQRHRDEIEAALVEALRNNDQEEYAAFKDRFAPPLSPSI